MFPNQLVPTVEFLESKANNSLAQMILTLLKTPAIRPPAFRSFLTNIDVVDLLQFQLDADDKPVNFWSPGPREFTLHPTYVEFETGSRCYFNEAKTILATKDTMVRYSPRVLAIYTAIL
jgi:hypothetical protein